MEAVLVVMLGGALLACLLLIALARAARPPQAGPLEGRLRPCPDRPNCVCSEDGETTAWVEPLGFEGPPTKAWERLQITIREMGGKIQSQSDEYIWATFRTKVFRFVDDVECRLVTGDGVIHVRSASRIGYSDLGLNRRRVEELRARFAPGIGGMESSPRKGTRQSSG
jgi:uncharacterized protein (DUF1499 family)